MLGIANWMVGGLFVGLEGAIEKYADCFLVYLFLGSFLLKTGVCVITIKNALLPHFYVLLWLRRVCVNMESWVAAKDITL